MVHKMIHYLKSEIVLSAALLLALLSAFFVRPDLQYLEYIDFRTLAILFSLMCIMAGLRKEGCFQWIAARLLSCFSSMTGVILTLVMLCFFFSMLITNDVALITFVPFAFIVLDHYGKENCRQLMIPIVVLQTLAANLGSMLTPIGNPQNLYLYSKADMTPGTFIALMFPYTLIAFVLLVVCCIYLGRRAEKKIVTGSGDEQRVHQNTVQREESGSILRILLYLLLFFLSLMVVAHLIHYGWMLAGVLICMMLSDRKILAMADYGLLATFIGFFIFIGNMGRIPAFHDLLMKVVSGNELVTAILSSQVISNVPAALLLSGFTTNIQGLIIGSNLGGLGTLIASMASLISYKYMIQRDRSCAGTYFLLFTVMNVVFLLIFTAAAFLL